MKPLTKKTFTHPAYFCAMGFGSGLSRWMPGTMGSLVAIPIYLFYSQFGTFSELGIILLGLGFGIWLCDWVAKDMAIKDPGSIVWDEFVGMWITLFMLPAGWYWLIVAFALFRFFDIVKPWPVSWLDKHLAGGFGIMLDDVAAGIYSLVIIQSIAFGLKLF